MGGALCNALRDDLKKVKKALPKVLADRKRGPEPKNRVEDSAAKRSKTEEPMVCPECGGKTTKNGTCWVLNWVLMLLRKRLQPMLPLVFKAFSPGYESVCVLMLEGVISQLEDPAFIIQTVSVQRLAQRL